MSDGRAWARTGRHPRRLAQGDWYRQAACAGHDPDHWYLDQHDGAYTYARQICETCPVKADCLTFALRAGERLGMWGGLSPRQRREFEHQAGHVQVHDWVWVVFLVVFILLGLRLIGLVY